MATGRKYSIEGCISAVLFIFLICIIVLQVVGRMNFFSAPIWTEELARWVWIWMAFIGIAEVERTNGHLRMEFLSDLLSKKAKTLLYLIIDLVYLLVMLKLCQVAYKTVLRTKWNEAVTLPFSDAVMYCAFFVASILIIIRVVLRILSAAKSLRTTEGNGEPELEEAN